jgi:hypothetical protein
MSWTCLEFIDSLEAINPLVELQYGFQSYLQAQDRSLEMIMLTSQETPGSPLRVYWSPGARHFAQHHRAKPCPKPAGQKISLLVGSPVVAKLYGFS